MKLDSNHIQERIKGSFIETLNICFEESDNKHELVARMLVTDNLRQTSQVLHGGATISLAETTAGIASNVLCAEDEHSFGVQISANHISQGQMGDTMVAKASAIHLGRTTHLWNVDIYSGNTGKIVSSVRVTNMVIKRK